MRADLQSKQSKLQVQIAVVKSQYKALTPAQREALAAIPPVPPPALPAPKQRRRHGPGVLAAAPDGHHARRHGTARAPLPRRDGEAWSPSRQL